jgi:DNA polymerase III, delta subunit
MAAKTQEVPWSGIREGPVILVSGPEAFLADKAIRVLHERLQTASPELEYVEVDSPSAGSGDLLQAVSPSLFGEPRLVVVWGLKKPPIATC